MKKKTSAASVKSPPVNGAPWVTVCKDAKGNGTATYHHAKFFSERWEGERKFILRMATESGISWSRNGREFVFEGVDKHPHGQAIADVVSLMILADELKESERSGAVSKAVSSCVMLGFFPHLRWEVRLAKENSERGKGLALKKHGVTDSEVVAEWQQSMDRISKTPGISRSRAWADVETEVHSKRETMEKYGVTCPIPARRVRIGKSSP